MDANDGSAKPASSVALRAADGHNDRRHGSRRHSRRFGTGERRRGERRKHALRSLLLAAATMSASHVSVKTAKSVPGLIPGVSVEMSNFVPIRAEDAYEDLIQEAASLYKLDPALIRAVMRTESAFNPGAVSPVGAWD